MRFSSRTTSVLSGVKPWCWSRTAALNPSNSSLFSILPHVWWPQPQDYFCHCFITVIVLLLWIIMQTCFLMVFSDPCERGFIPKRGCGSQLKNHCFIGSSVRTLGHQLAALFGKVVQISRARTSQKEVAYWGMEPGKLQTKPTSCSFSVSWVQIRCYQQLPAPANTPPSLPAVLSSLSWWTVSHCSYKPRQTLSQLSCFYRSIFE